MRRLTCTAIKAVIILVMQPPRGVWERDRFTNKTSCYRYLFTRAGHTFQMWVIDLKSSYAHQAASKQGKAINAVETQIVTLNAAS